jgi:hypothetical protein
MFEQGGPKMRWTFDGFWRALLGRGGPASSAAPTSPRPVFRDGDTFVPARILSMDEPLAVLHATSQALACCALAPHRESPGDSDTLPVTLPPAS